MDSQSKTNLPIILVDDEEEILFSSQTQLRFAGLGPVESMTDGRQLIPFLEERGGAMVILDLAMPLISGLELLGELAQRFPDIPVAVMSATHDLERAVECMKLGAFDYLLKPVESSRFISCVKMALALRALRGEVGMLKQVLFADQPKNSEAFEAILTRSRKMQTLFRYGEAIAHSTEPVLVSGETGVGKEILVEALHRVSGRKGPLVPLNVAGLDDTMFSDTLFGHRKGAFSGADSHREGLIAKAAGGTLFLDEIGDLKKSSQIKLLRLLQERCYYPLGADGAIGTDARIICATNQNLKELMVEERFRADLYFRLSAHQIAIPPLRERREDIPLLVNHFLNDAAHSMHKSVPHPSQELFQLLNAYDFPGNIRELRAMIVDAVARHESGNLALESFRKIILDKKSLDISFQQTDENPFLSVQGRLPTFFEAENLLIEAAIQRADGNKSLAANLLGITRQTLNNRLRKVAVGSKR
ncbi:MAG: sigma-54-dependent Fis family transcriptional regulator [Magnetococcales bacterium]|nr:sigma-54-dependent Fis family transcriptional regulator [Magnetococcales bacterium]